MTGVVESEETRRGRKKVVNKTQPERVASCQASQYRVAADTTSMRQGGNAQQITTLLAGPPHGLLKRRDATGRSQEVC